MSLCECLHQWHSIIKSRNIWHKSFSSISCWYSSGGKTICGWIILALSHSAWATFSWCSYLNLKDWRHISPLRSSPCSLTVRVRGHSCAWTEQAFINVTLGPYRWKQAPVWLSSGPRSELSKPITIIHSCNQYLTASWQSVLAQHTHLCWTEKSKRNQRAQMCVFSDRVHNSLFPFCCLFCGAFMCK